MSDKTEKYKFRKLLVWQRSIDFVALVYKITENFSRNELFGLTDQLRRAAVSIPLNIAAGSGSGSDVEFGRFLRIAQRSIFEVIAAIEVSVKLNIISNQSAEQIYIEANQISAMLTGLRKKLKANS